MKNLTSALCSGLAVGGFLLCGFTVQAQSQTYSGTRVAYARPSSQTVVQAQQEEAAAPQAQQPAAPAYEQGGEGSYVEGGYSDGGYGGGYCPSCQPGYGGGYAGGYGSPCQGRPGFGFRVRQFVDWFNPCGMCVHSPDHGFCPPAKRPIYRQPVAYTQNYPAQWTAQQAGYQQGGYDQACYGQRPHSVYWPTDTTQLGYYYQRVPQWHPNRAMYPNVPNPGDWHQYACGPAGQCNTCQPGPVRPRGIRVIGTPEILPYPGDPAYGAEYAPEYSEGDPGQMLESPTYETAPGEHVVPPPAQPTPAEASLRPLYSQPTLLPVNR